MDNTWQAFIKSILHIFTEKSHSELPSHFSKKEDGGWEVCPTTLLKLPQNGAICIEKGGPNNFRQVFTKSVLKILSIN